MKWICSEEYRKKVELNGSNPASVSYEEDCKTKQTY